jgi:hypothetical protein
VLLTGTVDGVNTTFTAPEKFRHDPPNFDIAIYFNGQRVIRGDDFTVSESGGIGTGYDTVETIFVMKTDDKIWADYVAV